MAADGQDLPKWRRCELAWMAHLAGAGQAVMRLADADHNAVGAAAPLMQVGDRRLRAPDIEATNAGVSTFWEVKYRTRPDVNPETGRSEFWMDVAAFSDYRTVRAATHKEVRVILFNGSAPVGENWLTATIEDLESDGRRDHRVLADGEVVDAWIWPADRMVLIDGPSIDFGSKTDDPVFPVDAEEEVIPPVLLFELERNLRGRPSKLAQDPGADRPPLHAGITDVLLRDAQTALDVFRRSLGIPRLPRYSVLRVGLDDLDLDEVLDLLRYGIRVFLITAEAAVPDMPTERLEAFRQARLLEWAVVPDLCGAEGWYVDGHGTGDPDSAIRRVLQGADDCGEINLGQYLIVHADPTADVLVTAGAGTGKTETMSERIVFLLATGTTRADPAERKHVSDLRLDDIALMTFTRESAAEMRRRIGLTLMLRQRICDRCALPAIAWLMQLSGTDVDTIHTLSKKILQRDGAAIGFGPGFSVGQQTMEFRRLVDRALSPHIERMLASDISDDVPPVHEFERFVREIWDKLAGNGLSPLSLGGRSRERQAEWGDPPDGVEGQIAEALESVVGAVADAFGRVCADNQTVPVSELVPGAIAAVGAAGPQMRRKPRYLFIDEFQDTDAEQMDLVLELRRQAGTRLFVVGDEKQGIYRFRGAQGNAFTELRTRMSMTALPGLHEFGLTRNFRSGRMLLDSLHAWFAPWGEAGFLAYDLKSRLRDAGPKAGDSLPAAVVEHAKRREVAALIPIVREWLAVDPGGSIALLCRHNRDAHDFRAALRKERIPCELRVGGEFFRSPAAREARVLLEAVLDPDDDAAILELCETRWFGGLTSLAVPEGMPEEIRAAWGLAIPEVIAWGTRVASLAEDGNFERGDLELIRNRVRSLAAMLQRRPTLAWLIECDGLLGPSSCRLPGEPDDVELHRYRRCLDHLISVMDGAFADSAISPHRILEWLRIQIATNRSEDEPAPPIEGAAARVTALTVHKAKGLEYDRVAVPRTWAWFGPPKNQSDIAIVGMGDGRARLIYKWRPRSKVKGFDGGFTNVARADRALWDEERHELVAEEARLLYVAMTRARKELKVFVTRGVDRADPPDTWADLIAWRAIDVW